MYCIICGDFNHDETFTAPLRFWSPDDGWRVGRFCRACQPLSHVKPQPSDFAYESKGDYLANMDEAIDTLFG
mgnify:CR=1 FL=1